MELWGRALYFTDIVLSDPALVDLDWWVTFLGINMGNHSQTMTTGLLSVMFGDSSGMGTGGTTDLVSHLGSGLPKVEPWMGVCVSHAHHFDSNWKKA